MWRTIEAKYREKAVQFFESHTKQFENRIAEIGEHQESKSQDSVDPTGASPEAAKRTTTTQTSTQTPPLPNQIPFPPSSLSAAQIWQAPAEPGRARVVITSTQGPADTANTVADPTLKNQADYPCSPRDAPLQREFINTSTALDAEDTARAYRAEQLYDAQSAALGLSIRCVSN